MIVNRSVNDTMSRTIITSGTTLIVVLALYLFGGQVIHGFALALVVGRHEPSTTAATATSTKTHRPP